MFCARSRGGARCAVSVLRSLVALEVDLYTIAEGGVRVTRKHRSAISHFAIICILAVSLRELCTA